MAELCAVVGESGSGKSSSLRNLDAKSTFIINVAGKNLPIKNYKKLYVPISQNKETGEFSGNLLHSSNVDQISKILKVISVKMPHINNVIIDDAQYLMAFEAMDRAQEKSYDKFTQMAQHFYLVLKEAMNARPNLKIFVLMHSENIGDAINPFFKIKTLGKMIDNMITMEGLFTYVLFTIKKVNEDKIVEYKFMTNGDGTNTAKSPMGCFDSLYIDNDLQYVIEKIDEYNG